MKTSIKTVVVKIGSEYYGFAADWVQTIVRKTEITSIPSNHLSYLLGIIDIHGDCMPVIDLHEKFNVALTKDCNIMLALSYNNQSLAVLVEQVEKIVDVPQKDIQIFPEILKNRHGDFIDCILHIDKRLVCLLSPKQLLKDIEGIPLNSD